MQIKKYSTLNCGSRFIKQMLDMRTQTMITHVRERFQIKANPNNANVRQPNQNETCRTATQTAWSKIHVIPQPHPKTNRIKFVTSNS